MFLRCLSSHSLLRRCCWTKVAQTSISGRNYTLGTDQPNFATPFKILFLGRDEFSCLVLEQLYASHDVWDNIWIVTQPDMKTGRRGSVLSISPLKTLGQRLKLPIHTIPPDRSSFKNWVPPPPFSPSVVHSHSHLLVTASFGRILPKSVLDLFSPSRRLNVHPSLLPAYRGAAPIQHALIDGQKSTGVCVIEMMARKKGIDAGEIWGQSGMAVPEACDFPTLRDALAREGGRLLVSVLRDMLAGRATSTPQPVGAEAPRAPLITADNAVVDFAKMTAQDIIRRHRAISHQKPLFAYLRTGKTLQLHSLCLYECPSPSLLALIPVAGTAIYDPLSQSLAFRCAAETVLHVGKVKQQDRSMVTAKEWWNGVRPDMRFTDVDDSPVLLTPYSVSAV